MSLFCQFCVGMGSPTKTPNRYDLFVEASQCCNSNLPKSVLFVFWCQFLLNSCQILQKENPVFPPEVGLDTYKEYFTLYIVRQGKRSKPWSDPWWRIWVTTPSCPGAAGLLVSLQRTAGVLQGEGRPVWRGARGASAHTGEVQSRHRWPGLKSVMD